MLHKKEVVIVKSLRRGCDDSKKWDNWQIKWNLVIQIFPYREEFLKVIKQLSGIRDLNLACIAGVCTQEEPICVLLQHSDYGDIPRFLELRSTINEDTQKGLRWLTFAFFCGGQLLYFFVTVMVVWYISQLKWLLEWNV